jgi:transcriptional regulator
MYIPKSFVAPSQDAVFEFVSKYSFACLIAHTKEGFQASHLPLEVEIIDGTLQLSGHVAKANPLTNSIINKDRVMVVFSEPHAYISSSWYDHINVPTWNYIAIHIHGHLRHIEGEELLDSISKMVDHYEYNRVDRFNVNDMPEEMLQAHLNGITGFKLNATKLEANYKLSQNRNDKNYFNIIQKLKSSEYLLEQEIAFEMEKLKNNQDYTEAIIGSPQ